MMLPYARRPFVSRITPPQTSSAPPQTIPFITLVSATLLGATVWLIGAIAVVSLLAYVIP